MKILAGLATLLPFTFGCSSNACSCSYGFYRSNGPDGYFCYRKSSSKATYLNAKEICESINATFPIVNSDEDLEYYTDIQKKGQWVQAEYRGIWGSKRWKTWKGKNLNIAKLGWYDDEQKELDEPTKGDLYGYIQDGEFYGATEEDKRAYICEYNIQEECDLAAEAAANNE